MVPQATECAPQALLPIIPPIVHRVLVAGSGPKVRPCSPAARLSWSSTTPGCTLAVRAAGSRSRIRFRYLDVSITRPVPVAWPATLVPAPRTTIGTSNSRPAAIAAIMSSVLRGSTTPSGIRR
ncbi:MAG: hypothetical protein L0Y54_05055 [Sporichthyaceae bacterium]|nr:hypothetical protein [Sporichthyaceae bacterium]